MRVTGGRWRSRTLRGPGRRMPLRPTPDAMRERAFAVLGERVAGARFLDLFAGTGAVGIEALSRGAARAVFVEHHRGAARLVEANLAALGVDAGEAELLLRPAVAAVELLARRGATFSIAWADPPFESWREGLDALAAACRAGVLVEGGLACLECPERAEISPGAGRLAVVRELSGGASRVVMLTCRPAGEDESRPGMR